MAPIQFDVGDDYDRKCGEMFLTLKGNIIFHCTLCEKKFEVFEHYADHVLLHYIKNSDIKEAITNEVQPAQLNDDNRLLVPRWQKLKPPPISELMTKLFETDVANHELNETTIKEEPIEESPTILDESQPNDNSIDLESFVKVEFSETGFSDNESTTVNFADNQASFEAINCIYECSQCNSFFPTPKNLQEHKNQQHPLHDTKSNCKWKKSSSKNLPLETPDVFVCDSCGKGFPTSNELQEHYDYYVNEQNTQCSYCSLIFHSCRSLHRHMGIHYHQRHYKCDICKARFKKEKGLLEHKTVHEKGQERTFACKMCGEKFKLKVGLKWHMRTKHSKNSDCFEQMEVDLGSHVDAMISAALL